MSKSERIREYLQFMPEFAQIKLIDLSKLNFFDAPASTKYHGAYTGGLFDHSFKVAEILVDLTEKLELEWERPESPFIIGMYHDLCKCDDYDIDESNNYVRNHDIVIPGHGDKSVIMLSQFMKLTDEEIACIRWHMGAYETDTKMWTYYGNAVKKYPNILYVHVADMLASHVHDV